MLLFFPLREWSRFSNDLAQLQQLQKKSNEDSANSWLIIWQWVKVQQRSCSSSGSIITGPERDQQGTCSAPGTYSSVPAISGSLRRNQWDAKELQKRSRRRGQRTWLRNRPFQDKYRENVQQEHDSVSGSLTRRSTRTSHRLLKLQHKLPS